MKKLLKYLRKGLLALVILITTYFLVSVILSYIPVNTSIDVKCSTTEKVFLSSNGVHVDIVIPMQQLSDELKTQLRIPINIKYVAFGWGDQKFYLETPTWSDIKISNVFAALFLNSETLMHVTFYTGQNTSWKSTTICPVQSKQLNQLIENSFQHDEQQRIIKIEGATYGYNDYFFMADGNYFFLKTCNVWVNDCLRKSNIRTALWTPFPFGLMRYFE